MTRETTHRPPGPTGPTATLFLAGDVMTGRGIDQALAHPGDPRLYEAWVGSAVDYLHLAERANGPIPAPLHPTWVWGDALEALDALRPDLRLVNLETSVTTADKPWPDKGIHYRMHPDNVGLLTAARLDACVLANNHVLDWGHAGLAQTLDVLHGAGIATAGAGRDADEAREAARFQLAGGTRLLLFALATASSGVPGEWAAAADRPGVDFLHDLGRRSLDTVVERVRVARARQPDGVPVRVVVSLHWGGNWGYAVGPDERSFARALIDEAGVDLVYGHSSHHPRPIEVHAGKLILYGCGDLINDYEGIGGHESFRGELSFAYLPCLAPGNGRLLGLQLLPLRMHRFGLRHASLEDRDWLVARMNHECATFGTALEVDEHDRIRLVW